MKPDKLLTSFPQELGSEGFSKFASCCNQGTTVGVVFILPVPETLAMPYRPVEFTMEENNHSDNSPQTSEAFRTLPNPAESFGTIPNNAEDFRSVPNASARKENHTLTVRQASRMFEAAGVGRTERSITNWCQPNKSGVARLDCYFDPNERKYYITPESVELAISEEKAKAMRTAALAHADALDPHLQEHSPENRQHSRNDDAPEVDELKKEIIDLKIANRAKDHFIEQLKADRESFVAEGKEYVERLMTFTRRVGELETQLLQLQSPEK
ncbi:MAG: hypothetical protein FJ403_23960 [Verrucomicrobia bacterium]|nr:hypothetical protein [Verrucomicrobiota bacterium]